MTQPSGGGLWHVVDLAVIGCVGVLAGLLVAVVAGRNKYAHIEVPDTLAGLVDVKE